jgi:glutamyl-tRNA reductase
MPLFTCGINHRSAPINVRERLAFSATQVKSVLDDVRRLEAVNEAVLLSTCNRTEIYMAGSNPQALRQWFQHQSHAANMNLDQHCYLHQDDAAVRHLLRVSTGLDSMVPGEPQILGQVKQAYRLACEAGTAGSALQHLFPAAFAVSKSIRQDTQIGAHPVSMAYASMQIAKRIFTHLSNCCVLLIGAGELIELMMTHLLEQGVSQIIVANRTVEKALQLAAPCNGMGIRIGDIPAHLPQADIVITATASQLPIIGKGMVERTLKAKKRRPVLILDLAVPRDIEPEVGQLADIYLYNIDDLQTIIEANLKNRSTAAAQAEALVEIQTAHYMRQLRVSGISDIITQFRRKAEQHRDEALTKALTELNQGRDPALVTQQLAVQLTNKILHQPTQKLRQFAYHQQADALALAKKLLICAEEV